MTYEVEIKFPLDRLAPLAPGEHTRGTPGESPGAQWGSEVTDLCSRLERLGAKRQSPVEQVDRYFNHPARDFAQTDEALRMRLSADDCFLTYKGPLVDPLTKTRREIEIPVGRSGEDASRFGELLSALGFKEIGSVRKARVPFHLDWENRRVELVLDDVEGLGTFLEIEAAADESQRDEVRDSLLRLAEMLGLEHSIRKSYLTLLLEREQGTQGHRDKGTEGQSC